MKEELSVTECSYSFYRPRYTHTVQLVRHTLWFSHYIFVLNHPDKSHVAETIGEINSVVEKSRATCLSITFLK